jgi:tetratricopeptide (TPR) repeat protein
MEARTRTVALLTLSLALLAAPALAAASSAAPTDSLLAAARAAAAGDRHAEAIALYEAAVTAQPALAPALAGERAYQLLWSDRLPEALALFNEALAADRGSADWQLGRARCLNWMGRHDEAATAYAAYLAAHPAPDPRREEAELGLAQAERWRGREDRALSVLESARWPIEGERRELRNAIRAELAPWVQVAGGKIHDSDPTDRPWLDLSAGGYLTPRLSWELVAGRADFEGYGYETPIPHLGAGLRWRAGALFAMQASADWSQIDLEYVDAYPPESPPAVLAKDYHLATGELGLTWRPRPRLRLDFALFRQAGPTPLALAHENHLGGVAGGIDFELTRALTLVVGGGLAEVEDGNRRAQARAALRWNWRHSRALELQLEPELRWLDYEFTGGLGYWSPDAVQAAVLRAALAGELGSRFDYRLEGGAGSEKEKNADAVGIGDWSAELGWRFVPRARLWGAGGGGKSRLDSAAGYRREWWAAGLRLSL